MSFFIHFLQFTSTMFGLLLFDAILISKVIDARFTCYECTSCTTTPVTTSTDNRLCFRIEWKCPSADVHAIDLVGDRLHSNFSLLSCGQTLKYSSACTIEYQCCYTNKCNTYDSNRASLSSGTNAIVLVLGTLLIRRCLYFE